jgi:hypothetical protein
LFGRIRRDAPRRYFAQRSLRVLTLAFAALSLLIGFADGASKSLASQSLPTVSNDGRTCLSVNDFNADPTGARNSTPAFVAAIQSANQQNGVSVCVPAGTYKINSDITLYPNGFSGTNAGGPASLYGAGPGLTVLNVTDTGNVFDSCPSYSDVTPQYTPPPSCPALLSHTTGMPNLNSTLKGITFSKFSILHSGTPKASETDFYFPSVQGLLIDNVCVSNSSNVFDFGQQGSTPSFSSIVVRDGTCPYQFSGHFMALHGNGSLVTVEGNQLSAGGQGLVLDTTDLSDGQAGSVSGMRWKDNVIAQPFIGMLQFIGAGPMPGPTSLQISDTRYRGNNFTGCVMACYYFGLDPTQPTPGPMFNNVQITDGSAISQYAAFYLEGGNYPGAGVQGIQIGGPSFNSGSAGGTASSFWILGGTPMLNDFVEIEWNPPSGTMSTTVTAGANDTPNSMASALAHKITDPTSPVPKQVNLANVNYGLMSLSTRTPPPNGTYNASPYEVIVSSDLYVIGLPQAVCSPPGPFLCYLAGLDVGDGLSMRDGVHNIGANGARITSARGAAVHLWQDGGDQFRFLNNVLGQDQTTSSYTALQLDGAGGGGNPTSFFVANNDLSGASNPLVDTLPTPAFTPFASLGAIRANRSATSTQLSGSASAGFTIQNSGPYDCTYYFSWANVGAASIILSLPGSVAAGGPITALPFGQAPTQVIIPVGGSLAIAHTGAGFLANYAGFCQP